MEREVDDQQIAQGGKSKGTERPSDREGGPQTLGRYRGWGGVMWGSTGTDRSVKRGEPFFGLRGCSEMSTKVGGGELVKVGHRGRKSYRWGGFSVTCIKLCHETTRWGAPIGVGGGEEGT